MYNLMVREDVAKKLKKISKKDKEHAKAISNKIKQITVDPSRFKPLHAPLQNMRRVHVLKSFVLIYSINEHTKTVMVEAYEHHDDAYRCLVAGTGSSFIVEEAVKGKNPVKTALKGFKLKIEAE